MKLYRKIYTNLASGVEFKDHWYRTRAAAIDGYMAGEGYMRRGPNYSYRIDEEEVTFFEWIKGEPK